VLLVAPTLCAFVSNKGAPTVSLREGGGTVVSIPTLLSNSRRKAFSSIATSLID